ncbi:MAG: phage tail protein [Methylococcales bacterium]|nr:phage tail protein [Methylococcales bacterium]
MGAQNFLPPIPQPPHDPTSWLLNGRTGWRDSKLTQQIEKTAVTNNLKLALLPESGRSLTEASGSFGGLTVPANVALGPDGSIYLLDSKSLELKRFDPCECMFKTVPCFGGEGGGARQFRKPHGIGICSGNLYVCDTGINDSGELVPCDDENQTRKKRNDDRICHENHRLSVFSLNGFMLRGHWRPPPDAKLAEPWKPYDIAFDGRGRVFVSDIANGCIHRFSPAGRWETCLSGFGKNVTYLAIDCRDRLYAVIDDVTPIVRVMDTDGTEIEIAERPEALAPEFPSLPFAVDAAGNLHLGRLCAETEAEIVNCATQKKRPTPERGIFDLNGDLVMTNTVFSSPTVYYKQGFYYSQALDSQLYRCQWHRIILRGEMPPGAHVVVLTYTAEALLPDDQVQNLSDLAWETKQIANEMEGGEWDCLVRSGGGRYLWLRLEFRGNGKVTPILESIVAEFPRISLRRYLPAVFGMEPVSADLTDRFLSLFDTSFRRIEKTIDTQARYFDPLSTPAERDPKTGVDFLSWLASWIGLTLDRHWPEAKRRQFLKRAGKLYDLRGTRQGLWQQLLLLLDMEADQNCCPGDQLKTRCRPKPANCAPDVKLPCAWQPPPLILEHYCLRRWLFLGSGRLGDQAVLWGKRIVNRSQLGEGAQVGHTQLKTIQDPYRDPFHVYAHKFTVFVPARYRCSDQQRKALENLLKAESPAHTLYNIEYVEPRFRIGFQSLIGFDSVIGRLPQGVTLNETPLGSASVLGAPPHKQGGPSLEIGKEARIGTTTIFDLKRLGEGEAEMTHHKHDDESQMVCPACEIGPFIRNNYFTGKLMLERDFTDEQRYSIEKLRHHHQRLHGWGVVCGLKVKQHKCPDRFICIEPGTAIDCCGHEIVVREEECIDITQLPSIKTLIDKKDESRHTLQVCLRYRECPTEEIPVLYDECGCDDTRCAPNRILESYDVDVMIVDSKDEPPQLHTLKLEWHCTVGPAHASRVVLYSGTPPRMYVISADNAKTVFQLDTDHYTVVGAHALPSKGLELAVSNDGARIYVVTEGTGGAGAVDRQLVVLDTANNMGNAPISTSSISGSATNDIFLSVAPAPDNRLFALLGAKGDVLVWPTTLDSVTPQPAPSPSVKLATNLHGLVIGSKAEDAFTTDTGGDALQRLDIVTMVKGAPITLSNFLAPSALALIKSTAPDMLAVVSESNKQLYLVGLNPDILIGSVPLDYEPVALAVSPGGQWAYVLEQKGATSYVQAVNLYQIQQKLSPVVGRPFKVGDASKQIVVSDSGAHLYIPFTDVITKPALGGVAVLEVSEHACEEILWRHLYGCPQCDTSNCVVIATIEHYQVGDKIEDQIDPPKTPDEDRAAHTTRIDNRKGRQLLPSTQVLLGMIECLMQHGPGGTGTQGPPGLDGLSIDAVQVTIIECEPTPAEPVLEIINGKRTLKLEIPRGCDGTNNDQGLELGLTRIEALSWLHDKPQRREDFRVQIEGEERFGIVIGFTAEVDVKNTIDAEHIFQVLVETPREEDISSSFACRCPIRGTTIPVDLDLDVNDRIVKNAGRIVKATVSTDGTKARGVAFILDPEIPIAREIINGNVQSLWIVLRGDFVKDTNNRAIDAEFVRAELPSGDRSIPPVGMPLDKQPGIQGGTFESWFSVISE